MANETTSNTSNSQVNPSEAESNQDKTEETAKKNTAGDESSIVEENATVARSAPDVVVESLHSTTVEKSAEMATSYSPDSTTAASKPQQSDRTEAAPKAAKDKKEKPAKEKAPAVENKPFAEFIQQDYLPSLQKSLEEKGIQDLHLSFEKQKIPILGYEKDDTCWQVTGRWQNEQRQFTVYFSQDNIQSPKAFSCADYGSHPSIIEPFLIDERKVTLPLMLLGVYQRLNAEKWLGKN
jgi:Protein of unknown function (DUF2996)